MPVLDTFPKQPGETEDFDISFADWLDARSDTIVDHAVQVQTGITLTDSEVIGGVVKVWLSGGTSGSKYNVTATITTAGGRIKEGDIAVKVKAEGL